MPGNPELIKFTIGALPPEGGTTWPAPDELTYTKGSVLRCEASAKPNWKFKEWQRDGTFFSSELMVRMVMDADHKLIAVFEALPGIVEKSTLHLTVLTFAPDYPPIEGALCTLGPHSKTTDAKGNVSFIDVSSQDYNLAIEKEGYSTQTLTVRLEGIPELSLTKYLVPVIPYPPPPVVPPTIPPEKLAALTVTVLTAAPPIPGPISGAICAINDVSGSTGSGGVCTLKGITPGIRQLKVSHVNFKEVTRSIEFAEAEAKKTTVHMWSVPAVGLPDWIAPIGEFFDTFIGKPLVALAGGIWTAVSSGLTALSESVATPIKGIIDDLVTQIGTGMSPGSPDKDTEKAVKSLLTTWDKRIKEIVGEMYKSPGQISLAPAAAAKLLTSLLATQVSVEAVSTAADQVQPVRQIGIPATARSILGSLGVFGLISTMSMMPLQVGMFTQLRYFYQHQFQPIIPDPRSLVTMYHRDIIKAEAYRDQMAYHGFTGGRADKLAEIALRIPDVNILFQMLWRQQINEGNFKKALKKLLIPNEYIKGYIELTKKVPPAPDLIRMVVREAFDPKVVVKAPSVFSEYMAKSGFSPEWSDRYWTAHYVPIALRQAYDNLWRGNWDKADFMRALHIADIHPMWREDIYNVAFRPPGVRELGYGYDTGEYSVEDIVRYRRWGGLSPEDAEKAGRAMVAYRTEAEREALRREALADYVAGLDGEAELRSKLTQIGGRPEIIDLWVARAQYRTQRDITLDLVKVASNDFVKGWSTANELRQDLIDLGVASERRDVLIKQAQAKRLGKKREDAAEKHKLLSSAKISKARELGLIGDAEFLERHVKANYTRDDAELLLAVELTPRPVTPEEVERRRLVITSRRARAERRWETHLTRVQAQIELTALQLKNLTIVKDEGLDIIDAQISIIDEDLPVVAPDRAAVLQKRRVVLVQRREFSEAKFTSQIQKLTEQHTDLQEQKTLMQRQRDEEIGEYQAELKLIGGVAG